MREKSSHSFHLVYYTYRSAGARVFWFQRLFSHFSRVHFVLFLLVRVQAYWRIIKYCYDMFRFSVFFLVGGEFQSVNVWIMSEKLFSDGELNE